LTIPSEKDIEPEMAPAAAGEIAKVSAKAADAAVFKNENLVIRTLPFPQVVDSCANGVPPKLYKLNNSLSKSIDLSCKEIQQVGRASRSSIGTLSGISAYETERAG